MKNLHLTLPLTGHHREYCHNYSYEKLECQIYQKVKKLDNVSTLFGTVGLHRRDRVMKGKTDRRRDGVGRAMHSVVRQKLKKQIHCIRQFFMLNHFNKLSDVASLTRQDFDVTYIAE